MPEIVPDAVNGLSDALVERARRARPLVARITVQGLSMRSGTLWRKDVVVASEQSLPDIDQTEVTLADGASSTARLAGRDPGTKVVAFRLEGTPEPSLLSAPEPRLGALVLAFGADSAGLSMRLGTINSVGPAWYSQAGARIDRRIALDVTLADREEGGPVLDAAGGGLLGISTLGPRRQVLVIPRATVDRVLDPLLSKGRVERGWLGLALQPVLVLEALQAEDRASWSGIDRPAGTAAADPSGQGRRAGSYRRRATIQLNPALDWLRVAVAAVDLPARNRLTSLVEQSGHEVVELEGCPDAVLSDGAEGTVLAVPTVAVGSDEHEFSGLLPADATARQIDAALRAVAAGLTVRAPGPRNRTFGVPTETWVRC